MNDLGDRADDATGNIYVENGEIKNSGFCESLPNFDIACLSNHAMPKLFNHVRQHQSDQAFILDQKYGCSGHFSLLMPRFHGNYYARPGT